MKVRVEMTVTLNKDLTAEELWTVPHEDLRRNLEMETDLVHTCEIHSLYEVE